MDSLIQARPLVIYFAVAISHITIAKAQCYYPGGAWAADQFPCDKYAYTTLCCPTGWTCFSNNLCIATDPSVVSSDLPLGTAIRGTCTNPLWNNTVCGDFCLNDPVSSNSGSVVPCGDNKWCCQPDSADGMCDCKTGEGTFQVSDGTARTIIGVVGLQHTSTATVSTSSTLSMISTASSRSESSTVSLTNSGLSSQASSSSTPSAAKSDSTVNLASITGTGSTSTATPTNQQILGTSTPLTQTTAFKAGVGAAAGVVFSVIVVFLTWLLIRWWRRRHGRGSDLSGGRWLRNPTVNETPFQVAPYPHPYGESQFSTSQSRAALAEQLGHNRRTPGPIDISEENNPYSDRYMAGGAGR